MVEVDNSKASIVYTHSYFRTVFFRASFLPSSTWAETDLLFPFSNSKTKAYQLSTPNPPSLTFRGSEGSCPLEVPNGVPKVVKTRFKALKVEFQGVLRRLQGH